MRTQRLPAVLIGALLLASSADAQDIHSLSDAEVRQRIVEESIRSYSGSCPCPYNVDRAGRRCGARSAYSRPGGASPICYPSDVSNAQVQSYRNRQRNRSGT